MSHQQRIPRRGLWSIAPETSRLLRVLPNGIEVYVAVTSTGLVVITVGPRTTGAALVGALSSAEPTTTGYEAPGLGAKSFAFGVARNGVGLDFVSRERSNCHGPSQGQNALLSAGDLNDPLSREARGWLHDVTEDVPWPTPAATPHGMVEATRLHRRALAAWKLIDAGELDAELGLSLVVWPGLALQAVEAHSSAA